MFTADLFAASKTTFYRGMATEKSEDLSGGALTSLSLCEKVQPIALCVRT